MSAPQMGYFVNDVFKLYFSEKAVHRNKHEHVMCSSNKIHPHTELLYTPL